MHQPALPNSVAEARQAQWSIPLPGRASVDVAPSRLSEFLLPRNGQTATPLASPAATTATPLPVPVKMAGRTAATTADGKFTQFADMGTPADAGEQDSPSTSTTIVRPVSGQASPAAVAVQFSESQIPRQRETLAPLSAPSAPGVDAGTTMPWPVPAKPAATAAVAATEPPPVAGRRQRP